MTGDIKFIDPHNISISSSFNEFSCAIVISLKYHKNKRNQLFIFEGVENPSPLGDG